MRPIALVLLLAAAGCTSRKSGESTLQQIERDGTVRIAFANESPFGYQDLQTGEVTGEAPEIARVILGKMGVTNIETTLIDFGQLIPGLKAGRYDLIAAGMYITPERCEQVDFSNPTYSVGEAFLVREGNPLNLHSFEDIVNNSESKLGVVGGTVELQIAEAMQVPRDRLIVFPDNASALAGLTAGRIDAFGGTALTVLDLLEKAGESSQLERAEPFEQPSIRGRAKSYGAFAFRQDDDAFREEFNRHLAEFIGTPEHLELIAQFGFTEAELPGDVTAEELCAPTDR